MPCFMCAVPPQITEANDADASLQLTTVKRRRRSCDAGAKAAEAERVCCVRGGCKHARACHMSASVSFLFPSNTSCHGSEGKVRTGKKGKCSSYDDARGNEAQGETGKCSSCSDARGNEAQRGAETAAAGCSGRPLRLGVSTGSTLAAHAAGWQQRPGRLVAQDIVLAAQAGAAGGTRCWSGSKGGGGGRRRRTLPQIPTREVLKGGFFATSSA